MTNDRRQRNHDRMMETILATARAIMGEEGVAALSMQELARRLDMRAPSLYHYFRSKVDIYDALFRLGITLYARHWQGRAAGAETWQDELRCAFASYLSFALENPELYQLCFERPVPGFVPSPESLAASQELMQRGYETVARWAGVMHTGLPDHEAADLLLAMIHGLTALHMANEPQMPLGQGRFGALLPEAVALFARAWSTPGEGEHL